VEVVKELSAESTWAYPPEVEVLYYHDKGRLKPDCEAERCQLRLKEVS
jgi:hypothetical protein